MNQLKTFEAIAGRRIERAVLYYSDGDSLGLVFEDGSFAVFDAMPGYGETVKLEMKTCDADCWDLYRMGLISHEEFEREVKLEKVRAYKQKEAEERALYESLKRKYG